MASIYYRRLVAKLKKEINQLCLGAAEEQMWYAAHLFRLQTENAQLRQLTGFTIKTTDLQPKRTENMAVALADDLHDEVARLRSALEEIAAGVYAGESLSGTACGDIARRALGKKKL